MNESGQLRKFLRYRLLLLLLLLACAPGFLRAQDSLKIVNDISQLNPIRVADIITPVTTHQISEAVKTHAGPISIGGGRYSMGGQTATEQALQIDMRKFDSILHFSAADKEITVQAGITWRNIQEFIDQHNLSVMIMQTYANFTVGGSLSVNVHGRYIGLGPIVLSVKQIKLVLASGELVSASPKENAEIFYGAIGGYGGLGVITEVTLSLTENCRVQRSNKVLNMKDYRNYFLNEIRNDSLVVFHNSDIYPNRYRKTRAITFTKTSKDVTVEHRLKPPQQRYRFNQFVFRVISGFPGGKWLRQHIIDPPLYIRNKVEWRNYEASYDVMELEPKSRAASTYILQEYFVPVDSFDRFYPLMSGILQQHHVNVINISIRHARKDPGTALAWARSDVFAFVIYFKQGTKQSDKDHVKTWTQALIDAAISCNGTYYMPYQVFATPQQFASAYPGAAKFFMLKKQLDPSNKFRNKLWDAYYKP